MAAGDIYRDGVKVVQYQPRSTVTSFGTGVVRTIQQPRYVGHTERGGSAPPSQFNQQIKQPTITRQWAQNAASTYKRLTQTDQARFVVKQATRIDQYIKREAQEHIPTLRDVQIAGYKYGKAHPKQAAIVLSADLSLDIFAASRGTTRLGKNKTAQAFADGAIKGVRNEPIKTLAMFALPGVVGGGLKIASKLPAVGRIVSNPGAMKIASGIIGIAYSKNIYDRVNADVLDGYKDGNVSESSKTLPNGDIQITQTITQIPIMRKPTTNEKAERLGGIWGTEVGPMALGTIGLKIPGKARIKKLTSISAKKTIKKVYLKEKGKAKKFIRSEKAEVSYTKKKPVKKKQVQKLLQKTKTVEVIDFSKLVTTKPVDVIDFSKMKHVELAKIKIPTTVAKVTRSQLELKTKSLSNMPKSLDAQMKILSQVNAGKIKIKPNVQNAIITGRKTSIVHLNKQTTILESKIIQNSKSITKLRSKTKLTTKQSLKLKVLISTRTKQIIKLKILYYQIAISKTIISQVQKNKQLPALIQKSIQKPKSKTKTVTKILPKTKTVIKPKTKTIIKPRPKTKIIVKPKPFEIKKPKIIVIKPKKKSVKPVKKTKRKKKSEAWIVKNPIPTLKTFVG